VKAPGPRRRRSVVVASVMTAAGLALLISLGVWQMERLAWKEGLIATLHERLAAPPAALPDPAAWPSLTADAAEFRRVRLNVDFPDLPRTLVYAGAPALRADVKGPGYFVFAPARLPDGRIVVVNAGWVPPDRHYQWTGGAREITGYLRWPETPGPFVSAHDAAGDTWFARDHEAMARLKGWGPVAPFYVDQEGPAAAVGAPRPGPLTVNLRNNHLGYAWTWFGLAGSLAGVFAFWLYFSRRRTVNAGANPSL
jgi:cytochrome oxidase assembly protein ShyY1